MLLLILITCLFVFIGIHSFRRNETLKKRIPGDTQFPSLEDAGLSQWKDFTLTSTPDMIKKGVTDISKYYI